MAFTSFKHKRNARKALLRQPLSSFVAALLVSLPTLVCAYIYANLGGDATVRLGRAIAQLIEKYETSPLFRLQVAYGNTEAIVQIIEAQFDANYTLAQGAETLVMLLFSHVFLLGGIRFCLDLLWERYLGISTVFSGFNYYFRFFGLRFLMGLKQTLWMLPGSFFSALAFEIIALIPYSTQSDAYVVLICIGAAFVLGLLATYIPFIIAGYRYMLAPYIFGDNPALTLRMCISDSKIVMKGCKGAAFRLHLSLIGWYVLQAVIVAALALTLGYAAAMVAYLITSALIVLYRLAAEASFFKSVYYPAASSPAAPTATAAEYTATFADIISNARIGE